MSHQHDIFISYAREDDLPPPGGGRRGWVTEFKEELEYRLRRRFGKRHLPRIWRDEENLAQNQPIRSEIRARLETSLLFVALHSTNYSSSDNCREEWEYFHDYWSGRSPGLYLPGERCRLLNVLLRNIAVDAWPPALRKCMAFRLCDSDKPGDLGDPTDPVGDAKRFDAQMDRLVNALEELILGPPGPGDEAGNLGEEGQGTQPSPAGPKGVFIAAVADTLKTTRNRLIAELKRQSWEVLPRLPPPFEPEHGPSLAKTLLGAALSVHLFDRYPGLEVEDTPERTYTQIQAEAALETTVPQLIWMPDRGEIEAAESEAHGLLLRRLEGHTRVEKPYRFLCGRREDLTRMVVDQLSELKKHEEAKAAEFDVLIDAENHDRRFGAKLMSFLEDRNVPCLLHQERQSADDRVDEFDENLGLVRALVILFGQADPMLVHRRLERSARRRLEARSTGATARLQYFSIFLPPRSRANVGELEKAWGWLNIRILDNRHSEDIDPTAVRPLVELTRMS